MMQWRVSQQQLNLFSQCPRKFQYIYLDQLTSPDSVEVEKRLATGERFHLLMQQRELCLPIDPLVAEDPQLQQCFQQLLNSAPDLFTSAINSGRVAEHPRMLKFEEILLVVVYDLLITNPQTAQIFDWKTYRRPKNQQQLALNWQTRLYLYVLVETSHYTPEQVSMAYWFIQPQGNQPTQSAIFPYTSAQHQKTHQDLSQLIDSLQENLQHYQRGVAFPQVEIEAGLCSNCTFALRCQRSPQQLDAASAPISAYNLTNLDDIQEIPI
ncbi:MAG: PD-(D/E)XK nuclease family protein [Microcoleaceae cyanobacterium]